jgi:hypothetical protein
MTGLVIVEDAHATAGTKLLELGFRARDAASVELVVAGTYSTGFPRLAAQARACSGRAISPASTTKSASLRGGSMRALPQVKVGQDVELHGELPISPYRQ